MPSKSAEHIAYTRLTDKHIENYLKNRSFTIKPSDHDHADHIIKLHYKTKKNLSKLNRNLNGKKGTRITPDDLHDMQIHDGSGFFDSIKKIASNPIAKTIVKSVTPIASNLISQQVKNITGSDALSNVSKNLINDGSKEMIGKGFNFNNIMKSKITKGIIKSVAPVASNLISQQVKNLTGSDSLANVSKNLINEGSKELTSGQGIKYIRSGGSFAALGSGAKIKSKSGGNVKLNSLDSQQFLGIGHNNPDFSNPNPHIQRMQHVRSFRKSNGIVM